MMAQNIRRLRFDFTGTPMMRFKFGGDRRNDWRCCFCCHVRTGTIFLGIWHLVLHILAFTFIAIILWKPDVIMDYEYNDDNYVAGHRNKPPLPPALPTPLSSEVGPSGMQVLGEDGTHVQVDIDIGLGEEVHMESILFGAIGHPTERPEKKVDVDLIDDSLKKRPYDPRFVSFRDPFGTRSISSRAVVTFCTFVITLLMVYGAVRNKPSYLMPFFCLQVFDFCIACLTAVGYLCYLPDMSRLVAESHHIPMGSQLRQLNPQCLSVLLMLAFLLAMSLKAYFIGVVWRCYKYLSLRRVAQMRMVPFIDAPTETLGAAVAPDSPMSHQEALLLLPDYDTAVNDPRYALNSKGEKKPLGVDTVVLMAPPPAYSSVVQDANQVVPEEVMEVPEVPNERAVPVASPVVATTAQDVEKKT